MTTELINQIRFFSPIAPAQRRRVTQREFAIQARGGERATSLTGPSLRC
jgi:hypothetical protein